MFSSPIQPPYQIPHLSPSLQAQAAPSASSSSFAGALPSAPFNVGGAPLQQQQQNFQLQPPPMPQQQQQQAQPPQTFPEGGVAGMDFAELQRLLGAEQFAQIMSGI